MSLSYVPPVNLHSPGPIGDTTPSTISGTTLTANAVNAGADVVILGQPTVESTAASFHCGVTPTSGNYFIAVQPGSFVRLNGAGNVPVQITVQLSPVCYFTLSAVTIQSGVDLVLGNAAAAGTITADHTLLIKDANGTSYKVPCVAA